MNLSVPIASALIGVVLLLFGRKLFWLFVAAIGFAAGVEFAPQLLHEPTPILALSIALVLGLLGAFLALFLQKIAIAVGGFLAGGQLATSLAGAFYVHGETYHLAVFIIGGIIAAVLLLALFNWALILLSAALGAHLILGTIKLPPAGTAIAFMLLVVLGIAVQFTMSRRRRSVA